MEALIAFALRIFGFWSGVDPSEPIPSFPIVPGR